MDMLIYYQSTKTKMISLNIYVDFFFSDTQVSFLSWASITTEKKSVKLLLKNKTNKQTTRTTGKENLKKSPPDLQAHCCILVLFYLKEIQL